MGGDVAASVLSLNGAQVELTGANVFVQDGNTSSTGLSTQNSGTKVTLIGSTIDADHGAGAAVFDENGQGGGSINTRP